MAATHEKTIKRSRKLYVIEAGVEYLISILVTGSFLATLTGELGMSDGLTGIVSAIISLGCIFQLCSVVIHRKRVKRFVVLMSIANQLLFACVYVIPLLSVSGRAKAWMFTAIMFLAYFIYNFAHPKKVDWFMSLINNGERGRFTAVKEMVSLIMGMAFSFGMGLMTDHYRDSGNIRMAFIVSGIVMLGLTVLHMLTMIFSVETQPALLSDKTIGDQLRAVASDRKVIRITVVFILWHIATYVTTPFYGTYQINELGFSLTFISLISTVGSIVRIIASFFLGAYADRKSFAAMLRICFAVVCIGFIAMALAVPANGRIMFIIYNLCYGFAMGGINSALTNLVFDHVSEEKRADALAISQAFAGTVGFLTTLVTSRLITVIQTNGNTVFGLPLYAQQLTSVLALLFTVGTIVYVSVAFKEKDQKG